MDQILKAHDFARQYHDGQKRIDGRPYIVHPEAVAITVMRFTKDTDIISAAYLHDVLEDTSAKFEDIEASFGIKVAWLVECLTNVSEAIKELGRIQYLKGKLLAMDDSALLIKLADRLHNVSEMHMTSKEFVSRYTIETRKIVGHILSERDLLPDHLVLSTEILQKLPNSV